MDKEIVIIHIFSCQGSKREHGLGSRWKISPLLLSSFVQQHGKAQTKNPELPESCSQEFVEFQRELESEKK